MSNIEIKVASCNKCPFSEYREEINYDGEEIESASCYAPGEIHEDNYDIIKYYEKGTAPIWCPLKTNNLSISFKK